MLTLALPLCIFNIVDILYSAADFVPFHLLISTTRSIVSYVCWVTECIFSVLILSLGLVTFFILVVLFWQSTQTLLNHIPSEHFILRHLEIRIKAELKVLGQEKAQATGLIRQYLEAIDEWDKANAQLLIEIRAAEAIIAKKVWDWKIVPERDPRSKTAGSTFFVHGPWSPRPLEAPEPSAWVIVRWWMEAEDPRVWAAKAKVTHQNGVLSDKHAVLERLQRENGELAAKRDETIRRRDAVQWGPCQLKPKSDRWAERRLVSIHRPVAAYQPSPAQRQTNYLGRDLDFTNERVHFCEFCGKDGHRWRYQYGSFAAADAAPFARPCHTATTRVRPRPPFVSAGPIGGPSFFDPDVFIAPQQHPQYELAAAAPLLAAPTFPPSVPCFPAPSAPFIPAQAARPLISFSPAQELAPKVLMPVSVSIFPPSAPQVDPATSSSPPPAAPVAMPATAATAATAAAAPIVKTAPAAPRGKEPPRALQVVWPVQASTSTSSSSGPAVGGSLMSRSSFATAPGQSAAVAPSGPSQANGLLSHEQAANSLVKEESTARALEKAAAKKQKELSVPRVEKKKNYRF